MRASLNEALTHIERYEGGYVNHPRDPGGETNRGITIATARAHGYAGSMRDLTREVALTIYRNTYWTAVNGDGLPPGLDLVVFDMGVNAGPKRGARLLQRELGVAQDGKIGPITLAAAWDQMSETLLGEYRDARLAYYRSLRTWRTFGRGWAARTEAAHRTALALLRAHALELADDEPEPCVVESAEPEDERHWPDTLFGRV